jgi:TetR/AcrR family transcriptional regulator
MAGKDPGNVLSEQSAERRAEIVEAARQLYDTQGLASTTVKDITEKVGVSRSLLYHYFASKEDVTQAVLDSYVEDFVEMVRLWNESRVRGDVRGALVSCVKMLRRGVFDSEPFRWSVANSENAGLYQKFISLTASRLARFLTDTTAVEYARYHYQRIDHVYETFYLLVVGLVSYVRQNPDAPDELLEDLIAQALRLDLDGSARRDPASDLTPEEECR